MRRRGLYAEQQFEVVGYSEQAVPRTAIVFPTARSLRGDQGPKATTRFRALRMLQSEIHELALSEVGGFSDAHQRGALPHFG